MEIETARAAERPGPAPRYPELVAHIEGALLIAVRSESGRSGWYQVRGRTKSEAAAIQARMWDMNRRGLRESSCRIQSRRVGAVVKFRVILRERRH